MEKSKAGRFTATVAEYQVGLSGSGAGILPHAQINGPSVAGLQAVLGLLVVCLAGLLTWNCYKGHIPLPWNCWRSREQTVEHRAPSSTVAVKLSPAEDELLAFGSKNGAELNKHREEAESNPQTDNLPSLQFIDDESEI